MPLMVAAGTTIGLRSDHGSGVSLLTVYHCGHRQGPAIHIYIERHKNDFDK